MPKKIGFLLGFLLIAILALAGYLKQQESRPPKSTAASASKLCIPHNFHDFGEVPINGGKVSYDFPFKNDSNETVVIEKIYTSCMCTEAILVHDNEQHGPYGMPGHGLTPKVNFPLAPQKTALIKTVFDPAAHGPSGIGPIERMVTVATNRGTMEMQIKALVTP